MEAAASLLGVLLLFVGSTGSCKWQGCLVLRSSTAVGIVRAAGSTTRRALTRLRLRPRVILMLSDLCVNDAEYAHLSLTLSVSLVDCFSGKRQATWPHWHANVSSPRIRRPGRLDK